jgi:O-antigen ligase
VAPAPTALAPVSAAARPTGAASGPAAGPSPGPNALAGVGFWILLVFVFIASSRWFDLTLAFLHIPLILSVISAALIFAGGGLRAAIGSPIGKLMCLFTLWMIVCVPFSEWRGGSVEILRTTWAKSFLVFLMVAGAVTTVTQVRRMMITIGLGTVGAMLLAHLLEFRVDGRLSLPIGFLANPNDLAQVMLVGVCFLAVLATRNIFFRGLVYLLTVLLLFTVFETGSRSGILATGILGVLAFSTASPGRKLALLVMMVGLGGAMFTYSRTARMRLSTLLADAEKVTTQSEATAVESRESRIELLKQSLLLTLYNPIFGVGPGVFQASAADLSHDEGKRALWRETHNSYTQVSSESGIPGILFFGAAVWYCIRGLVQLRKRIARKAHLESLASVVNPLLAGFLTFVFTAFFSSVAYHFFFSLMIGTCAASIRVVDAEIARLEPALAPAPAAAPARTTKRIRG